MKMEIRKVKLLDANQIAEIYNHYILTSHATFEIETVDVDEIERRIEEISANYPYFVLCEEDKILGYAYASRYKSRAAYKPSVEISVYVRNGIHQKGIGTRLYTKLFEELNKTEIHAIIAGISLPNEASVKLHEKFGMKKVAHFEEVGFKFERWIDVGYWEIIKR
ncbi:MAG TPA: N-acetyltransferase family protein [Pyrinomonadaceae bacterium]|nr:N-acetyltransferase family protein [Pyrinomonadaceae bacterium]